jgi:hypothetical protein
MQTSEKPRIFRRFIVLSSLGVIGAVAFTPSIIALSAGSPPTATGLSVFVLTVSAICIPSAWIGLRLADAAHLPMPWLRRLDGQMKEERPTGAVPAIALGVLFAIGARYLLHHFNLPNLPGSLWSRMASVLFAPGSLEVVVHLLIMSLVVRLTRGKVWMGVVVAAVVFVIFHATGLTGQSIGLVAASILLNGALGLVLGALYARYGFEYLILCHAVSHVLAVTFA